MKFYVIRHCSTAYSEQKIYCGATDIPLSELGRREAEALTDIMRQYEFDAVVSSPLLRARQTADAVLRAKDVPLWIDPRLGERRFGIFEETSVDRPDGKIFRYSLANRFPGGESYLDVAARVYPLLDELKEQYAGCNVVLVSHGSVCRTIRSYFTDMTDAEFYGFTHPNGAVLEYGL